MSTVDEIKNRANEAFEGDNKDTFETLKASAIDAVDLMTALQGEIYKKVTGGGEAGEASEDNFFCWATPGIPVSKEDFAFASEGFRPIRFDKASIINATYTSGPNKAILNAAIEIAKKKVEEEKGSEEKNGETADDISQNIVSLLLDDKDMKALKADATYCRYMQAEAFAHLVDFIPDTSGWKKEGGSKMQVLEDEGSLSDAYKYTLIMSQVKHDELTEEEKKKLAEKRAVMIKTVVQESDVPGVPPMEMTEQTSVAKAYNAKMSAYKAKVMALKQAQIDAYSTNDPEDIHRFALTANLLKDEVQAALYDWETAGYKAMYEQAAAYISSVENRSMVMMKEEYKKNLRNAYVSGLCSGQEYPYTTLSPADFADTGSWTKMVFDSSKCNASSARAGKASGIHANVKTRVLGFSAKGHYDHEESENANLMTFDFTKFKLEFEICQVDIVRPWFKPAFLNSKYWRFAPGNKDKEGKEEMLSDGEPIPQGLMPAYPTSIIFMRNLKLVFEDGDDAKEFMGKYEETSHGAKAGLDWIFGASAGYEFHESSSSNESADRVSRSGRRIEVNGMQIIGFRCHLLGKCPDPLPTITDWA